MPSKKPETPQSATSAPKTAIPKAATFAPVFWEAYNEITTPNRFGHYFRSKWMRDLGPVAACIVEQLRDRCYHNRKEGVLRDEAEVSMEELAASIGVSVDTVSREFKRNETLPLFVRAIVQYHEVNGKPRRKANAYQVSMDDPVHPDDMERYELLRAQKECQRDDDKGHRYYKPQSAEHRPSYGPQSADKGAQNAGHNYKPQSAVAIDNILSEGLNTLDNATGGEIPPINSPKGEDIQPNPELMRAFKSLLGEDAENSRHLISETDSSCFHGDGLCTDSGTTATREEVWSSVLARLEKPIRLPLKLIDLTETTATLATTEEWARGWLEDHKGEVLQAAFAQVLGSPVSVAFVAGGK